MTDGPTDHDILMAECLDKEREILALREALKAALADQEWIMLSHIAQKCREALAMGDDR